jgi:hypothetical protein
MRFISGALILGLINQLIFADQGIISLSLAPTVWI